MEVESGRAIVPPLLRVPERAEEMGRPTTRSPVAVPVGGGGARPATRQRTRFRRCGGRRRNRRARAGFEFDHSEPQARVWRSRGRPGPPAPEHQRATNNNSRHGRLAGGPPPTGTHSAPAPEQGTTAPGTPATQQPMFHVKHLPNHRPRYPVSRGKWHT